MIQINDNDLPITVAEKIITGTMPYKSTETWQNITKAITGTECGTRIMFDPEEIKEIADYLMVYYRSQMNGSEVEDGN